MMNVEEEELNQVNGMNNRKPNKSCLWAERKDREARKQSWMGWLGPTHVAKLPYF